MPETKTEDSAPEVQSEEGRRRRLAHVFVELADTMVADFDLLDFLMVLAERSVELLAADAAGLMLSDQRGHLRVLASTSEQSRVLELFELQNAEGPCLDSFHSGQQVVNIGLDQAQKRWPIFTREAADAGFRSVHALPLRLRGTVIGAINLFCKEQMRLSADDLEVGQALADVATIGLLSQHADHDDRIIAENLQEALVNRDVVEQAKGILAERLSIDMAQGFHLIRQYAHKEDIKIATLAANIVEGTTPAAALRLESVSKTQSTGHDFN